MNHIHSGKSTEIDNEQQPKQYEKLKINNCKYCGAAHGQRQWPEFGNMQCVQEAEPLQSSMPELQGMNISVTNTPPAQMHAQNEQDEEVTVPNQEESNKSFESVSMKSLMFHSVKSVIFNRLELSTSQKRLNNCVQNRHRQQWEFNAILSLKNIVPEVYYGRVKHNH